MADIIDGEEFLDPTRPFYLDLSEPDEVIEEIFRDVVPASYDVSFVRIGSSSSLAIINGQRVSVGDVIGGATVMAIDRGGVTLIVNEQEQRVNLYQNDLKAPVVVQ